MDSITIETISKLLISAAGAITGWYAVLKPLVNLITNKKKRKMEAIERTLAEDKQYRKTVLDKLEFLEQKLVSNDVSLALIQRDNIERAYCIFVLENGYCPSGMKMAISDTYDFYKQGGHNHIAAERVKEIMDLPEFPQN